MVAAVFSVLVGMVVSDVKTQQTVVFFFFFLNLFQLCDLSVWHSGLAIACS